MSVLSRHPRTLGLLAGVAAFAAALPLIAPSAASTARVGAPLERSVVEECPPGYQSMQDYAAQEAAMRNTTVMQDQASDLRRVAAEVMAAAGTTALSGCISLQRPESLRELFARAADQAAPRMAPTGEAWEQGAFASAVAHREGMRDARVEGGSGTASQYGQGPLISEDPFGTAALGIPRSAGRVDDLEYVAGIGIFAAVGTGGIWFSPETGVLDGIDGLLDMWVNLGDSMPTTTTGSVAWSSVRNGTIIALTGDPTFGGIGGTTGEGVYYVDDFLGHIADGQVDAFDLEWEKAAGVPEGGLGFKVAVDPVTPSRVYAATQLGLFQSTDGAQSFRNVNLNTGIDGECKGVTDPVAFPRCTFANVVTDVVVQQPGGTTDVTEPAVVAAVGWRGGAFLNPGGDGEDAFIQSPTNGIYKSPNGDPDSFEKTSQSGFTSQERIGRIELGPAVGADQNHEYLYAMVQDSVALNGGCTVIDAPDPSLCPNVDAGAANPTFLSVLEGVYVSADFGETWTLMADAANFASPTSGSALNIVTTALIGFGPGTQAWYNLFALPDPTVTAPGGIPGRLIVGLEEVWQNETTGQPMNGPTSFKVIGQYFAGDTCQFLTTPVPVCPTNRPNDEGDLTPTTTHPDQHSAIFVPSGEDGLTLVIGNDGGIFSQTITAGGGGLPGTEFDNGGWGISNNDGFQTLLPYDAAIARDGRAWFGLQDNGSGFVDPTADFIQRQAFGGDGFFVAVDPFDSDIAYYEFPAAGMNVTQDGGLSSADVSPPAFGGPYRFSNPFQMDTKDARHLVTAGTSVFDSIYGPGTSTPSGEGEEQGSDWREVFDLGTRDVPGSQEATATATDPDNTMSAIDVERNAIYAPFCGVCDIINTANGFENGIATNVAGDRPQRAGSSDGWHIATAEGLPNRFITSVAIDEEDPRTVFVTLGGYSRKWLGPNTANDANDEVGEGNVYKSVDAGETFVDWSGNLPDVTATWVEMRGDQLLIGTDVGAFVSDINGKPEYQVMEGLPHTVIGTIMMQPGNPNRAVIATYGRGVWVYDFATKLPTLEVERHAGQDRIRTAIAVSEDQFPQADTVVVATSAVYADALSVGPLAWQENAPILLTSPGALDAPVAAEVLRLGARKAIIAGGEVALSATVEAQLKALGVTTQRFAGEDRFETAALIAAELSVPEEVYLVEGVDADPNRGWPDALAIGPVAATKGNPILLTPTEQLPANTAAALESLGTERVAIVGGTVAVSQAVEDAVADLEIETRRIAGDNRYATSVAVAEEAEAARLTNFRYWFSRADFWADALAAGSTVARNGGILLLTPPVTITEAPEMIAHLRDRSDRIASLQFLGGQGAIAANVPGAIVAELAKGPAPEPPAPPLVGETLANFSFDGDDGGWVSNASGVGDWQFNATQWQVVPYIDEHVTTLTSPGIPFEGGALQFDASVRWNTEECCDFFSAEWSSDGENYNPLFNYDALNPSYPAYDTETHTFVAPPGEIFIRFKMSSDQLVSGEGAYVESVTLTK